MRWNFGIASAATLLCIASKAQADVFVDSETGFTFSQYSAAYSTTDAITFRIAVPSTATAGTPYDAVIQVVAPSVAGWAGLAWGGSMTNNPLTIGWANGNSALASVRRATSHTTPTPYDGATLEILSTGTKANGTHWQYTAKCTGCTSFVGSSNAQKNLDPKGSNRFAFAYSKTKPSSPSSVSTTISVHDVYNYWNHDFAAAANSNFDELVEKNL
ncbi:CBD9-like protein [Xylariaceae sp. FL0662B]|nr:CBD9-like protein [Xylariaceae sp. FL0662B]